MLQRWEEQWLFLVWSGYAFASLGSKSSFCMLRLLVFEEASINSSKNYPQFQDNKKKWVFTVGYQWNPAVCVGEHQVSAWTPSFCMNSPLNNKYQASCSSAGRTNKTWVKGLSCKCAPHFLHFPSSSPPPLSNMHFSSNFLALPSLCLPSFLLFHSWLFNCHGNRWCGSSHRDGRSRLLPLSITHALYIKWNFAERTANEFPAGGMWRKCESVWPFKLTGLQMEELTPTDTLKLSKPPTHTHPSAEELHILYCKT